MDTLQTAIVMVILAVAAVEAKRGFGRGLFDFIGALVAVLLARSLAGSVAPQVHLLGNDGLNEGVWLLILFVGLGTAFFFAGRWLYGMTLVSLDAFDGVFGAVLGLASGVAIAHVVLIALLMGSTPVRQEQLRQTRVCRECVNFETYNGVVSLLTHLGE